MFLLIGYITLYAWIHAIIINFTKLKNLSTYEKVVMWTAFVTFILFFLNDISSTLR
jgi:hypothetical protein